MGANPNSRYLSAGDETHAPNKTAGTVRFHAGGFSLGYHRINNVKCDRRVIRFMVHHGQAVEISLDPVIAGQLGLGLLGKGGSL